MKHDLLFNARKKTGLSQLKFSQYLGIPFKTYTAYENRIRNMSIKRVCKIAEKLDIPVESLMNELVKGFKKS